ncbi:MULTISPECIES: anti-phage dCTP deaminase [unclassified Acidovorax]|uniref:anti-phage dCTP deaminase n=1 Tax=unclassified Acidovorax TaxID=2684926 RepID=UPI002883487C|nr:MULTISPECIES: anti-phage dCTP deaminase [unclassified Acidovorax]
MSAQAGVTVNINEIKKRKNRTIFNDFSAAELIFAIVGPVGSGTSFVAKALETLVRNQLSDKETVQVVQIKASKIIEKHANKEDLEATVLDKLKRATLFQDVGDEIRREDPSALAVQMIAEIKNQRELLEKQGVTYLNENERPKKVFIIDSLKHPEEAALLRGVYRESFCLIGVVCEKEKREKRLKEEKCPDSSRNEVAVFMKRDENEGVPHGQKVAATFHLSDFFVDNTEDRETADRESNPNWDVNEKLGRLIDILQAKKVVRPTPSEAGMFYAHGAQHKSACLSRQVGASLTDRKGNLIATGTNEVPRAGGGVYGGNSEKFDFDDNSEADHRCFATNKYCSNTKNQAEIIEEVIQAIPELKNSNSKDIGDNLKKTRLGQLIEFSRAVHAEMDALLSAGRQGKSTVGSKLFVTTFPCHYCARHIVTAGIEEVQYIEPYPKSKALTLHQDAIGQIASEWISPFDPKIGVKPKKVLFRPFTGVAPRLYQRAFVKDRELKDGKGDFKVGERLWSSDLLKEGYTSIENALLKELQNG